nr:AzlD domain-containing protein [Desulfovibrio aminophilus]
MAVAGMALVTYLTRAAGLFLVNRLRLAGRSEAFMRAIPGAVLVSILAPSILAGGLPEWAAAGAVVAVSARFANLPLSLAVGVGAVWLLRAIV